LKIRNSSEWISLPIDSIKPYSRSVRRHSRRQITKLKELIGHFGQVAPIIVDANRVIVDGHAFWQAMRELGSGEIAAVAVTGRSDPEIKALRLALNRIPSDAVWDNERLRREIQELVNLSFDVELTGFDAPEIDHILDVDLQELNVVDADIPAVEKIAVSVAGDVWVCGHHRVGCGDARDQAFVDRVRHGKMSDICFVDPPYNVPIAGFVSGKRRDEFTAFLGETLKVLRAASTPSALIFACMGWPHVFELIGAGRQCGLDLLDMCVWAKTNAGMGSLYRSQHELICIFKAAAEAHAINVELGRHARSRSNLWTYRGFNAFGSDRDELLAHPTVKPVLMIADALRDVTKRGGIVLDTFLGSGSTLMAAEETGRHCFGIELDPLYVDLAIRRWQTKTARDAFHAETGELFEARARHLTATAEETRHGS
jgi:DNA modification methylase